MTTPTELIQQLRDLVEFKHDDVGIAGEAADALEQQAAEIEQLRRWKSTHAPRIEALEGLLTAAQMEAHAGREAIATIASERAANALLTNENAALRADAERYRWLDPRLFSADFAYGDPPICAIVFKWPETASVGADLRASIDAALRQEQQAPCLSPENDKPACVSPDAGSETQAEPEVRR